MAFNVLISSAGRRVALLNLFRNALRQVGVDGSVYAADVSSMSAAWHAADARFHVPPCTASDYIDHMLRLCRRERITLVVPTIDTELAVLAANRTRFTEQGTTVLVSAPPTVSLSNDKVLTNRWLREHSFPTVDQALSSEGDRCRAWPLPLIAKPRGGSSSTGLIRIERATDWDRLDGRGDYVIETVAAGQEFTVDALVTRAGRVRCVVPRLRLEVRGGEVSKALTVKSPAIEQLAFDLVSALPGAYGPLNVQMFRDHDGQLKVIEINARFGGGFPLSAKAGADFPAWIIRDLCGSLDDQEFRDWTPGIAMLRYDAEVFVRVPAEERDEHSTDVAAVVSSAVSR